MTSETHDPHTTRPAPARSTRLRWIVAGSLGTGLITAVALPAAPFVPAQEEGVTGAVLVGFAVGWAMLAFLSTRFTAAPQRWAAAPAVFTGFGGLILLTIGAPARPALDWIWPPAALALGLREEAPRGGHVQARQAQYRERVGPERPGGVVPGGEDHRHAVGLQLPGREQQRVRRRRIQPVGVVDDTEHGPAVRRFGEDGQGRHAHQERLDRRAAPVLVPEDDAQRPRLRCRQPVPGEHGTQEPVEGGERQRRFRRDPRRGQDADGGALRLDARDQVGEERGLPDARISQDHQDRRSARTRRVDERGEPRTLDVTTVEHAAKLAPGRSRTRQLSDHR